jgi:branched-chain amino acid transport system ATP-binding protein
MQAILTVEGIRKRFGGFVALDGCSFDVPAGSITGVIGPNGAGKSTLFNIVAGVIAPDAGRTALDCADVTGLPAHALFARGLVRTFQIPHEFARMTALENLMVAAPRQSGERLVPAWFQPRRVRAEERAVRHRAAETLEVLGLAALADTPAGQLSGGQKKLLELGRTMMTDARLVLLDEPAAGVNRALLGDLMMHIERLHRTHGISFCIIEHDLDLIGRLCDPVMVMAQGRVLARGDMASLRADPAVREAYLGEPVVTAA